MAPKTLIEAIAAIAQLQGELASALARITELEADVDVLTIANARMGERLAALEQLAPSNERRITALENDMAAHKAGAIKRQLDLERLKAGRRR